MSPIRKYIVSISKDTMMTLDLLSSEEDEAALTFIDNLLEENPSPQTLAKVKRLTKLMIAINDES